MAHQSCPVLSQMALCTSTLPVNDVVRTQKGMALGKVTMQLRQLLKCQN